jgi:hypothetical protein
LTFRRRLAARLRALAERLDPPVHSPGGAVACAKRMTETLAHAAAGRIRRRKGESIDAFAWRLAIGDFQIVDNLIDFQLERARRASTNGAATRKKGSR